MEAERDEDLAVMRPDAEGVFGGEAVTVREFRALDGWKATALARPLLDELAVLVETDDEHAVEATRVLDMLGRHPETFAELIALSTGKPREWIEQLPDAEGLELAFTFYRVNAGFFVRRLVLEQAAKAATRASREPLTCSATLYRPGMGPIRQRSPAGSPGASVSGTGAPGAEPSATGEPR